MQIKERALWNPTVFSIKESQEVTTQQLTVRILGRPESAIWVMTNP